MSRAFLITLFLLAALIAPLLNTDCNDATRNTFNPADSEIPEAVPAPAWSFAVITDLHIGSGINDYAGFGYNDEGTMVYGEAATYAEQAVREINGVVDSLHLAFVAVLGDLSDSAERSELRAASQILNKLRVPWIPLIGNHDTWPLAVQGSRLQLAPADPPPDSLFEEIMGPQYQKLAGVLGGWGRQSEEPVYDPEEGRDSYLFNFYFDFGGFHFVCLDFSRDGYRAGDLHDHEGGTWPWFQRHMESYVQGNPEAGPDVVLLSHHPMASDGADNGTSTFAAPELDRMASFTNGCSYSYVDAAGAARSRPYSSRIWGQIGGHIHQGFEQSFPAWLNGPAAYACPAVCNGVSIGIIKVDSDTGGRAAFSAYPL